MHAPFVMIQKKTLQSFGKARYKARYCFFSKKQLQVYVITTSLEDSQGPVFFFVAAFLASM